MEVKEKTSVCMPVLDATKLFVNVCHPFVGQFVFVYEFKVEVMAEEHVNADIH
jgi:hypothetical protein